MLASITKLLSHLMACLKFFDGGQRLYFAYVECDTN